ncbi:sortase [Patescibacteria group bacterium]|nr:sortase [Patescibacteria group bacterium]
MRKIFIHISISILLGVTIFCLFNYNALTKWLSYNLVGGVGEISVSEVERQETNIQPVERQSDRIQIPKIGVAAPVIYNSGISEQEIVDNLNTGVVFYNNSDLPNESGLAIYFGHSSNYWWRPGQYDTVFSLIPKLVTGDQIDIYYSGQKYTYQVTDQKIISQQAWSQLQHFPTKNGLALVTCWPLGTTWRRYVVWAEKTSTQP